MNSEQAAAIARLIAPLIVMVGGLFGITIDSESTYALVATFFGLIAAIYAWWWKNNNITKKAQQAQNYKNAMTEKSEPKKSEE